MHNENHPLRQLIITQYLRGKEAGPVLKVDLDQPCPPEAQKLSLVAGAAFLIGASEAIMKGRRAGKVGGPEDERDAQGTLGCLMGAEAHKRLIPVLLAMCERDRAAAVFATPDPDDQSAWVRHMAGAMAVTRLAHAIDRLGGRWELMPSHDDLEHKADIAIPLEGTRGLFLQVKSEAGRRGVHVIPAIGRRENSDALQGCTYQEKQASRQLFTGVKRLNANLGLRYEGAVVTVGTQGLSLHQLDDLNGMILSGVQTVLSRATFGKAA